MDAAAESQIVYGNAAVVIREIFRFISALVRNDTTDVLWVFVYAFPREPLL